VAWRDGTLSDRGAGRGDFKTPTLRDVARTAPYMHDGSMATLDDVVEFYDGGGRVNPSLDPEIRPLRLTADERQQLVSFLRALSGEVQSGMVEGGAGR
jgi:cytochrome c peroxidase